MVPLSYFLALKINYVYFLEIYTRLVITLGQINSQLMWFTLTIWLVTYIGSKGIMILLLRLFPLTFLTMPLWWWGRQTSRTREDLFLNSWTVLHMMVLFLSVVLNNNNNNLLLFYFLFCFFCISFYSDLKRMDTLFSMSPIML